jgi:hypothetical protein
MKDRCRPCRNHGGVQRIQVLERTFGKRVVSSGEINALSARASATAARLRGRNGHGWPDRGLPRRRRRPHELFELAKDTLDHGRVSRATAAWAATATMSVRTVLKRAMRRSKSSECGARFRRDWCRSCQHLLGIEQLNHATTAPVWSVMGMASMDLVRSREPNRRNH